MEEIYFIVITLTNGNRIYINNVISYSYDRDFVRVHCVEELQQHKCVAIYPTNNICSFEIEFKKVGENNA